MQQQKCVRSFSRGFFPTTLRFLALALAVVLSAGVASAQTFAYVTDQLNNSVLVYDASTLALVAAVPVGLNPQFAAATPDQTFVYVSNRNGATVSVIDTATNLVVATVPVGAGPRGVAVTPDGAFVYVANSLSNSVSVIATLPIPWWPPSRSAGIRLQSPSRRAGPSLMWGTTVEAAAR